LDCDRLRAVRVHRLSNQSSATSPFSFGPPTSIGRARQDKS
jgi:hypothetical protein